MEDPVGQAAHLGMAALLAGVSAQGVWQGRYLHEALPKRSSSPASQRGQIMASGLEAKAEPFTSNPFLSIAWLLLSPVTDKECSTSQLLTSFFHEFFPQARRPGSRLSADVCTMRRLWL